jgi:hypothetical protein
VLNLGRRMLVSVPAVALAVATAAGATQAISARVVGNAAQDVVRTGGVLATTLSGTGGAFTTILKVSLPAGSWVVTAEATVVPQGDINDTVRCSLFAPYVYGQTSTYVSPQVPKAQIVAIAGFTLSERTTVKFRCTQEASSASPAAIYGEPVLWAHRSSNLNL